MIPVIDTQSFAVFFRNLVMASLNRIPVSKNSAIIVLLRMSRNVLPSKFKTLFPSGFPIGEWGNAFHAWQVITFPCLRVFDNIFRTFGLIFQSLKGSKTLDL